MANGIGPKAAQGTYAKAKSTKAGRARRGRFDAETVQVKD